MNPDIAEALTHAYQRLRNCTPNETPILRDWIDKLLDMANIKPATGKTHHQAMREAMGLDHDHV